MTVVVKGTFDLVEGGPAALRGEPDPVLGDIYADDDPENSLVYASDLTIFKPRCDVTVVGHAHAPRGSARLIQVRLYEAKGKKVRFDGSHMPKARCGSVTLTESSLRSVEAPGSEWDKATLEASSFAGAALMGAGFSSVKGQGADFNGADAPDGRFRKADLRGARFIGANLMKATFEKADLQNADLRGANLHEAETWKAKLKGAELDLAIVTKSKLAGKKG
jgi:uncharacterized protein YjbI with pentapeptide repeats